MKLSDKPLYEAAESLDGLIELKDRFVFSGRFSKILRLSVFSNLSNLEAL